MPTSPYQLWKEVIELEAKKRVDAPGNDRYETENGVTVFLAGQKFCFPNGAFFNLGFVLGTLTVENKTTEEVFHIPWDKIHSISFVPIVESKLDVL